MRNLLSKTGTGESVVISLRQSLTAIALTTLWFNIENHYFFSYFIFFSALLVTFRTDLEHMLIARVMTVGIVPIAFLASLLGWLPISPLEAIIGAFVGYGVLWFFRSMFYLFYKKEGIGQGDLELMAAIGAFTGPIGCWLTLTIGSIAGSCVGILLLIKQQKTASCKLPFGSFLVLGAICYTIFKNKLVEILFF